MDGTLDFTNDDWMRAFNPNNASQTCSIFVKTLIKYLFRHVKGKSMINFYIINALG